MAYFGKDKCEYLRNLRVRIAEANGIDYVPAECHHEGDCPGFCPVCDGEMEFIAKALEEKANRGENIKLSGLQVDDTRLANYASVVSDSEGGIDDIRMGEIAMEEPQETVRDWVRERLEERRRQRREVVSSIDAGTCTLDSTNRKYRRNKESQKDSAKSESDIPGKLTMKEQPGGNDWPDDLVEGLVLISDEDE